MNENNKSDHDLLVQLTSQFETFQKVLTEKVSQLEFAPVKLIVYGMAATIFTGFLLTLCGLVYKNFGK